jgi:dihydrofolate reductase
MPKYVVSNSLAHADWTNTTILSGDLKRQIGELKAQPGGELVVYGSPSLVDQLLKDDLVDELRLLVYPVILGSGKRMFRDHLDTHHLRLVRSRTFGSGVELLCYEPAAEAPTSRYVEEYSWTQEQIRSLEAAETSTGSWRRCSSPTWSTRPDSRRRWATVVEEAARPPPRRGPGPGPPVARPEPRVHR